MAHHIPDTITFDSLMKSGVIPRSDRSGIERAWDRLLESKNKGEFHALEAIKGLRQVGESGVTGAILGAIHGQAKNGLDMAVGQGATASKVPIDGVVMALGFAAGVFAADEPHGAGKTAMNASAAAAAIFMFRQTNDFVVKMNIKKSGITPGGGAALPNAQQASLQPGMISKASFAGESSWGNGFHPGSRIAGEDRIASLARNMK